jgi:NAD(P)-dependent dehydrogenase (short-subunit alcohol dehydrogenase family)
MQIADHGFLVSGAAGGLGAACARMLVAAGGRVVLADMNEVAGRELADQLGRAATFVQTDVADAASVEQAIEASRASLGALQGVVHCAGILAAARVVGRQGPHDLALFERVIRVNLVGTFNLLRLAAATMTSNAPNEHGERGVIVNTASVAAFEGQIGQTAYAASKGGVASLTLPAARELGRFGIRVIAIAPGAFETAMMAAADEVRDSLIQQTPFPARLGRPEEFASLVREVIANPMLNGAILRLDGALRMGPK